MIMFITQKTFICLIIPIIIVKIHIIYVHHLVYTYKFFLSFIKVQMHFYYYYAFLLLLCIYAIIMYVHIYVHITHQTCLYRPVFARRHRITVWAKISLSNSESRLVGNSFQAIPAPVWRPNKIFVKFQQNVSKLTVN